MAEDLLQRADQLAARVAQELEGVLPLLSAEQAKRPNTIRDRAEFDIAATRVGRMLQLLQGAQSLAHQHFGTAIAPVTRAMWETWFDLAWMLHDPAKREEMAEDFWTAGVAQQLGVIRTYEARDGYLVNDLKKSLAELEADVMNDPRLYKTWLTKKAQLKVNLHVVKWARLSYSDRAKQMGPMYERAYDIDYTLLSVAAHGEGMELPRLIGQGDGVIVIAVGEGEDAAIALYVESCGIALTMVYEIQRAYAGSHSVVVERLKDDIDALRKECKTAI